MCFIFVSCQNATKIMATKIPPFCIFSYSVLAMIQSVCALKIILICSVVVVIVFVVKSYDRLTHSPCPFSFIKMVTVLILRYHALNSIIDDDDDDNNNDDDDNDLISSTHMLLCRCVLWVRRRQKRLKINIINLS